MGIVLNNNALNVLKDYNLTLDYSENLEQILNNNNEEKITNSIGISINKPVSMNNQTKLSDNNIPYSQLNNPIVFDEKESLFPDYTGEINSNNFLASNISNINYFIKKKILSQESSIINDNIILTINKPAGFDTTLKDVIEYNGKFKLFNSDDNIIHTEENLINNIYNNDIIDYILSNLNNKNQNTFLINYFNELPLKILDNTFYIDTKYQLNTFCIKISINHKNNVLSKIISTSSKNKFISNTKSLYEIQLNFIFDINTSLNFPLNFLCKFNGLINNRTNLITNSYKYLIVINDAPIDIDLIEKINNGYYKNLYILFK